MGAFFFRGVLIYLYILVFMWFFLYGVGYLREFYSKGIDIIFVGFIFFWEMNRIYISDNFYVTKRIKRGIVREGIVGIKCCVGRVFWEIFRS